MNDVLSARLRALRVPPPGNEFERRLEQGLWREAHALRAERSPERPGAVARARRWGGRTGLALAVVLGATAAAAAGGGLWAWVAKDERGVAPVPPLQPTPGAQRPAAAKLRTEPAPTEPAADLVPPAPPAEHGLSKPSWVAPAPQRSRAPAPPGQLQPRQAARAGKAASAAQAPSTGLSEPSAPGRVLPLELPSREISGGSPGSTPVSGPSALARPEPAAGLAASDRRSLPELRSRADRRRKGPERPDRARGAEPPGRALARERSGRDNAQRGLERAREAHERK